MPTVTTPAVTSAAVASAPVVSRSGHLARTLRGPGLATVLPALLMLVVGLAGLDRHSVWRDEAASLVAARRSLGELVSMLAHVETVHAVYYTFLHAWLLLGSGAVWARVPSVLAMVAAAGLVGALGARLVSVRTGLVAGLLFAVNPSVSFYAQEARSTALVTACALAATLLLVDAPSRGRRRWVAYAVVSALLVGLHLFAVLVLAAHGLTLLLGRRRDALRPWAVAVLPALAVAGVIGLLTVRGPNQSAWIPAPDLSSVKALAFLLLGPSPVLVGVVGLLLVAGLLPLADVRARRLQAVAVPLLVLAPVVLLATSFVVPVFVPRYVFPSVAAAALLAALGLERLAVAADRAVRRVLTGRSLPGWLPTAAVLAAVLVTAVAGLGPQRAERTPTSRSDDLTAVAALVGAQAQPGDAVLFVPDNRRLVALLYPDAFVGVQDVGLADSPEAADNLIGRNRPLDATLRDLQSSPRVWVLGRPGLETTPGETDGRAELDLLDQDFTRVRSTPVQGLEVALFVRRSAVR